MTKSNLRAATLIAALLPAVAAASFQRAARAELPGIQDRSTQGRDLQHGVRPAYPASEIGQWSESCISVFFTVRPDGKADDFVLLESDIEAIAVAGAPTLHDSDAELRRERAFVRPVMQALLAWEYEPARQSTDEIVVFRFERPLGSGELMHVSAQRLDLASVGGRLCGLGLDADAVRQAVGLPN